MENSINESLYKPVALQCRKSGRTLTGLWRLAIDEGRDWGYKKFIAVCNGYLNDKEIEAWLDMQGFGDALLKAKEIQNKRKAVNE